nr:CoA transferase [Rhodococcus sp. (in: high G+C Gram-positive bacteria)]
MKFLDGIRVVTLAVNLPGPIAAARLAKLGATVIKIEPPNGDPLASLAPRWYAELTGQQEIVTLDLRRESDRAVLAVRLTEADLLITSMRPSALRRLHLRSAHEKHSNLSHVEIVGHDEELEDVPGHDLTYQAAHGTLQPPLMPTVPVADLLGAERAVSAALLALRAKDDTGIGQHHRVVLDHAAADAGAAVRHHLVGEGAPLGGAIPTYGIYATADGYVALGALEPHFRRRTLDALVVADSREQLERVFATESTAHWQALAVQIDIPLVGIRDPTVEVA